ncbi:protein of unknown function DUF1501 [Pirellula staleyi DSM 6068]|uniref:DUF1501 domain-containing protein n=1 Tax=Pirellula staleyi (strain ATCC 27377 / DSM 6068 / ICPB 4128) TaxID=530564 RepID=D2R1T0_PIRSD|nr:DUF1501 domain-containing protein [Pirellula staleyi]ADB16799.1 protein of unknown function DUF1501 [Pirellula staleyi DSM 6068]
MFAFHRQTSITLGRGTQMNRREVLRAIPLAAASAGLLSWTDLVTLQAEDLRKRGKACILLWMGGGPSQFETWSPKPGTSTGGETKAIETSVAGIQISENMPNVAKQMQEICLIRSMNSREGAHPRATYLMHTGYLPTSSVKYPTLGSLVSKEIGDATSELPSFVRIGLGRGLDGGAGLLGVDFDPFSLQAAGRLPDNTALTTSETRFDRRLRLLSQIEGDYAQQGGRQVVSDHQKVYAQTAKMIKSPEMKTFELSGESAKTREAYGSSNFGKGCLLARRLIESGVTFVEVTHGNWDTHDDNFARSKELCGGMDQPYAALLADLKARGLLDSTLVVWMGEFGRTPRVNPRAGRDHYPKAFSVALSGCGVKGGQVIGATNKTGEEVTDKPVGVSDLLRTICHRLEIDADKENMSSIGRPIKLVDGGEVIQEVAG